MPVNSQTIKIPIEAEITNVSKTISELRELTKNIRPDTKGFKDINTLLDQAERKLLDVQKRSVNGLIDKRALTGLERSFGEVFASVETAANKLQHIDFSGLVLSDAQKDSLNSIAIAIEKARTEYSKIETSKLDELAKSGKNVVESFNLAKIDLNTDGINSSIDKIDNKIEELNKSLNTLQNRKNEKVRLIEIEQSELDKLNKIKQIFTAKEGAGRAAFSDIFTASGDKFKAGGKEALHGMLTALGIDDISIETLKNTSATKIQELWDSIEKKVEEVRREHESRRRRLSSGVKTDEQNIGLKTQDIASLTELRGNIEALKVDPDVKEGFIQLTNEIQRLTLENEKLKQGIIEQAGLQSGAARAIKATGAAADGAARKIEEASNSLDRMNKITNTLGNMKSVIARWMGFYQVINLSRRAIRSMVQDIRELDKVMTEIAIVTNMTQQDLWNQMNTYQSIAKEYAVSTKGVYEVSQLFYQQGLDSVTVMKLTTETLKMAKIAGLDYSTATDYMTVALRGFHLEMDQAQNVVDVYSNIASKSASSTEELANAMSKTASSAAAVGSSFENTTAMIALMVETTRESSQNIGSALKSIISRYGEMKASPAKLVDSEGEELDFNKVDTALKSVGISLKNAQGQFRDFDEVILELSKKWQTLDVNTQRYIATIMAGNRQQSRFLALVGDYERLVELTEAAANSQDVATLQTIKTLNSLESKIQNVKTAWQGFYANLGLEAVFKGALEIVTNILNRLNQMPKLFGKLPIGAASIAAQMISIIKSFSTYVITKLAETWTRVAEDYKKKMAQAGQEGGRALTNNTDRETKKLSQKWNDFKTNKNRRNSAIGTALSTAGMVGTAYAMSIGDDKAELRAGVQAASGAATLAGSIFSGFSMGGPLGAVLGGVTGLIAALPNLTNAINDVKNAELLAIKASEKKIETYKKETLQAKQEANDISNTIEKLKQLEEAKYSSNEAYEEWLNYKTQIADSYPELISYYTLEGEAILDLSKGYDTLAKKRKEAAIAALKEKQEQNKAAQKTAKLVKNTVQNLTLLNGAFTFDYLSNNDWGDANGSGLRNVSVIAPESNGRTRVGFTDFGNYIFSREQSNLLFTQRPTGLSNNKNYLNTDYSNIKSIRDSGNSILKQVSAALLYEALNQEDIFDLSLFKDVTGVSKTDLEDLPALYEGDLEGLADRYLDIFLSYFKMADSMAELEEESATINEELAQMGADFTSQVEKIINNSELPDKEQYSHLLEDDSFVTLWNNRMLSFAKEKGYKNITAWLKENPQEYNKQAETYIKELYEWYTKIGDEVYTRAVSIVSNTQDYTTQDAIKKELENLGININEGFGKALISSLEQTWTEKNEKMKSPFREAIKASTNLNNKDVSSAAIKLEKIADGQGGEISSRYLNNIQTQWYNLVNKASSQYDRGVNATFLADIYSQTSQLEETVNNSIAGILSTADLSSKEGIQAAIDSIETYQSTITDEAQKAVLDNILSDLKTHKDQLLININTELAAYSKSIDEALEANEKIHKTQSSGFDKISDMETAFKKINANRKDKLTFDQVFTWDKDLNKYIYSSEGLQAALDAQLIDTQKQYNEIIKNIGNIDTAIEGVKYLNLGVSNTDKYSENFDNTITNYIKKLEKEPKGDREEIINARIEVLKRILAVMASSDISFEEAIEQIKEQNESDRAIAENLQEVSDQMTKSAELSRASKAFDYSSYLSSGRTTADKEKLEKTYNEYNNARMAVGEETLGTFEEVVSTLEAGGTAAIDLAQSIANDRGNSLQPSDIENLYSQQLTNYKNALNTLKEGIYVGSIVTDKGVRDILDQVDGFDFDEKGVVTSVGNMIDAFIAIFNAMKGSAEATTKDLNESYLEVIQANNQKDAAVNNILSSASSFNSGTLKNFVESVGGAYSLDKILDANGDVINGWSASIERIGIDSYRITDWDTYKSQMEAAIGHALDETTNEYIDAYASWLDTNANADPTTVMTQLLPNLQKLSYAQIGLIAKVFNIEGGIDSVIGMIESNGDGTFNGGALLEWLKDKYKSDDEAYQRALINQKASITSSITNAIISYTEAGADRSAWDEATFNYAFTDYEKALKALGESAPTTLEALKQELEKGGEAAVIAAEALLSEGQKLSAEEVETLYRANVKRWIDAIDTVTAQPGAIIDQTTATIINNTGGLATEIGDSGQYVVETATNLYEAYNYILNELVIGGNKNISDLNKVAAKALENRDGEQVVIDALGDAASMTYTRLGEILEQKGIELTEQYFDNNLKGIVKSIGGGKVRIEDFNAFADLMGWEANSEEYWSAFKTYNDAMVELNRKAEHNIMEELQNALNAQQGDWVNLTQLTSKIPEELLNQIISGTGAVIEDGILKLDEGASTNIAEIVNKILDITSSSGLLLDNEVNELKDAIQNLLNTYINLFKNGISGSLSSTDADKLQNWASTLNPDLKLDFTRTAEGLKLSNQSATELYQTLKSVDSLRANLLFNDLAESLQKSDDRFSSISRTMGTIANLENQIKSARGGNTAELEKQLSLAQEIARVQAADPSSYDFMGRSLPDVFKGPQNYWNSIGEMFKAINTSAQEGYMDIQDFYNIVNEMNNLAALGTDIDFMGHTLNGSLESAASLIEAGFSALTNIDGEGVKIDLSKFGVDFASGADQMNANVHEGIKAIARSQIAMLDALINLLEAIVAMEDLGNLEDIDSIEGFSIGDIFQLDENEQATDKFQKQVVDWSKKLEEVLASNELLEELYNSISINGHTLYEYINDATDGVKNMEISSEQFFAVLDALRQIATSNDYDDIDDVIGSIQKILAESGLNFDVVMPDGKVTVSSGFVLEMDSEGKWKTITGSYDTKEQAMKALLLEKTKGIENVKLNEETKEIEGTLTIGNEEITAVVENNQVVYSYKGTHYTSQESLLDNIFNNLNNKNDYKDQYWWEAHIGIRDVKITEFNYENINEEIRKALETAIDSGNEAEVQTLIKVNPILSSLKGLTFEEITQIVKNSKTPEFNIDTTQANAALDDTKEKAKGCADYVNTTKPKLEIDTKNAQSSLSAVRNEAIIAKQAVLSASGAHVTVDASQAVSAAAEVATAWQNAASAISSAATAMNNDSTLPPKAGGGSPNNISYSVQTLGSVVAAALENVKAKTAAKEPEAAKSETTTAVEAAATVAEAAAELEAVKEEAARKAAISSAVAAQLNQVVKTAKPKTSSAAGVNETTANGLFGVLPNIIIKKTPVADSSSSWGNNPTASYTKEEIAWATRNTVFQDAIKRVAELTDQAWQKNAQHAIEEERAGWAEEAAYKFDYKIPFFDAISTWIKIAQSEIENWKAMIQQRMNRTPSPSETIDPRSLYTQEEKDQANKEKEERDATEKIVEEGTNEAVEEALEAYNFRSEKNWVNDKIVAAQAAKDREKREAEIQDLVDKLITQLTEIGKINPDIYEKFNTLLKLREELDKTDPESSQYKEKQDEIYEFGSKFGQNETFKELYDVWKNLIEIEDEFKYSLPALSGETENNTKNVKENTTAQQDNSESAKGAEEGQKKLTSAQDDAASSAKDGASAQANLTGATNTLNNASVTASSGVSGLEGSVQELSGAAEAAATTITAAAKAVGEAANQAQQAAQGAGNVSSDSPPSVIGPKKDSIYHEAPKNSQGGRAKGNVAFASGTRSTLMGELGPELYVANGHYYVAGQHGAEFVDLPSDAIVFNHLQTERLLKNGSAGRGKAVTNERKATSLATGNASGPAMASASAALAALKQIRAMWDAMLKASISDLGSKAGLGKKAGGGGGKDKGQTVKLDSGYIRDLERWYNLLRQIDRLEQDINYEEKLRSKLQADTVANGELIYESQRRTYEMLQRELDDRVELASLKKGYYEQRMAEIQAGPWGQLFYFNEEGVPQMKNLQFLADVFASSEEGGAVHNAREQYAMLQQAGFGSLLQYKDDGSAIEWTDDEGKPREEAYKEAVEAFSAKLDAQTEEVNSLREDYIEEMGNILDLQTQQNEILTQIRENTIAVEQEVLNAIEDFREREIDELQKQRDALSDSADKFIDGLTDSLNKEREMYNSQQEDTELLQMRRQLAILQRSGGSASQIRSLQEQIRQREQEAYFNEQENQINAIKEASDLQLERLDAQISLMQETLEYQKAHGLLWDQVHEIMQGTHEEITQFVTGNNSEWWAKSATQAQNDLVELDNKIGQWVAHRDDISALGETMKNAINNGIAAITSVVAQVSASQQYTVSGTGSYTIPSGSSGSGDGGGTSGSSGKKKSGSSKKASNSPAKSWHVSASPSLSFATQSAAQEYQKKQTNLAWNSYHSNEDDKELYDEYRKWSTAHISQYSGGGLIDYTGLAWVDGTKKKPEGMLNAEQLDMLRNSVLTRKNPIAALLADYGNTVSDTANANTYNSIDRGGDTVIENAQVVMNVSKMSNDYDAKRAGKTALEEMLRISRKTKPTSVSRR